MGNVTIKMYFEISSGLLLRSTSQISLAKEKDPTNQIYWEIEKYITQINEISINYEYSLPTSPLPTTTTDQPRSPLDTWTIIGWIMLIAGGAAIIIGAGRWSKVPEDPTSMQDE